MTLVAGIDSSTQSTKVLLVRAEDGSVFDQASAPHPAGTEADPESWWQALQQSGADLIARAEAVGVGGQQQPSSLNRNDNLVVSFGDVLARSGDNRAGRTHGDMRSRSSGWSPIWCAVRTSNS